jgi:hypothetical protein
MSPKQRLALVAALLAQSCVSCPFLTTTSPTPTCSGSFVGPTTPAPEPVHAAGQEVSLTLIYELSSYCSTSAPPTATSVRLEVTDPDNRAVDANASAPERGTGAYGNEAWRTTVTFTPSVIGPYHVIATFEPGVGLVQRDVYVVNDRRGESPTAVSLPSSTDCDHIERTARGALLCQTSSGGVTMFRNGSQVATWSYAVAHTAGDVIWVQGGTGGLSRNLDNGIGPPQLTASVPASLGERVFAATADEALVWSSNRLKLYRFNGTNTLVLDAQVHLSISVEPRAVAYSSTARSLVIADWNRWTRLPIPAGESTPTPNWTENENVAFQGPEGLWINPDPATFKFVPADSTKGIYTLVTPPGWQNDIVTLNDIEPGEHPLLFPLRTNDGSGANYEYDKPYQWVEKTKEVLVPSVKGATISFSAFNAPPDAGFVEVTQGLLRATRGNEQLFWNVVP